MSNATVTLLEEIAHDTRAGDAAVRTQVALIRSLIDEMERRAGPSGDEVSTVKGMTRLLTADGHPVTPFTAGAAAVEALGREPFDAVVTDLDMPHVHNSNRRTG